MKFLTVFFAVSAIAAIAQTESTNVSAVLKSGLDAKKAKAGDEVVARTTSSTRMASGATLPKGTRLLGSVTGVQAKGKGGSESHLAFRFDRAVLKDGHEIPINAVVRSVSAPASLSAAGDSQESLAAGPIAANTTGTARASGGGLLGGTVAPVLGTATGAIGGVARTTGAVTSSASTTIPGLMVAAGAGANQSTILSSRDRNVQLEAGTRLEMNLSTEK